MAELTMMFLLHFIADFILQSREMGKKKSEEFPWLIKHLKTQFHIMFLGLSTFLIIHGAIALPQIPIIFTVGYALWKGFMFAVWNTVIHGIIDWNIWSAYKYSVRQWIQSNLEHPTSQHYINTGEWKYYDDHMFYVTIGFDQLLHTLTIIFLYWMMFL